MTKLNKRTIKSKRVTKNKKTHIGRRRRHASKRITQHKRNKQRNTTKKTKQTRRRIRYRQRGGFIMGDFVNLGRNILYNTQSVWSGFKAEPPPVNPNPYKDQFEKNTI